MKVVDLGSVPVLFFYYDSNHLEIHSLEDSMSRNWRTLRAQNP